MEISPKCKCGCGTELKPNYRGVYYEYSRGHYPKEKRTKETRKSHTCNGYLMVHAPNHPRANKDGFFPQHILIAEAALGKYMPEGAEVHHVNSNRSDNRPENLVICPDGAYHMLLHKRQRALDNSGDPNKLKCNICKKWDSVTNLKIYKSSVIHKLCEQKNYLKRKGIKNDSISA